MTLKSKFIIYAVFIHLVFMVLLIQLVKFDHLFFVVGEILMGISLAVTIWFYRGMGQPFNLISSGIEAIKDKDFNLRLVKVGHKEMDELIEVYNQMIDQLREERIRQSEKNHLLDKLIQASPAGIIMLNEGNKVDAVNAAARRMLDMGTGDVKGFDLTDMQTTLADEVCRLKDGDSIITAVNGAKVYKCTKAHFVDLGYAHYFIIIEELTDEIYKKEKSAYEKVIRMMSHEVNNSIGAINSILSTFLGYKDQLEPERRDDYKVGLSVALDRNTALSKVMANFAKVVKIPDPVKEPADLTEVLRSVQILMEAEGKSKQIDWEWQLAEAAHPVLIDVEQMQQVLINILKNAIEAVNQKGKVIITSTNNPLSVSIKDNGSGISDEASQKLFSPFFSTKTNGQGIGLTIIREVLQNHNFKFSLETEGGWTEFKITFV